MTLRLLQTVAVNEKLKVMTGDIGNAFIHANANEKICTKAGPEFGNRIGCKIILKKKHCMDFQPALGNGILPWKTPSQRWVSNQQDRMQIYRYDLQMTINHMSILQHTLTM